MARRYLQTSPNPSPAGGGSTTLALLPSGTTVELDGAAAPSAGYVLTATGPNDAEFQPAGGGVVDDPTVRTSGFTAVANTRYFVDSYATNFTAFMPAGPVDGDIVAFIGLRDASCQLTVNGNGPYIRTHYIITQTSFIICRTPGMNIAFRYSSVPGLWETISGSVSAAFPSLSDASSYGDIGVIGSTANRPTFVALPNGDSVPGRVANGDIQELRPWSVAHNLFSGYSSNSVYDTQTGTVAQWTPSGSAVSWYRAMLVRWDGAADLIVRSLKASSTSSDFRQDKILWNSTTNRVLTLNHLDSGALLGGSESLFITGASGLAVDSGYKYRVGPGEFVRLIWNPNLSGWLVLAPVRNGGQTVDAKVQTTAAAPITLHTYTTSATVSPTSTERIYAYKVRIQAIKTVGTTVGDAALFDIAALFYRNTAGTVVVKDVAFINGPYKDAGAVGWDVTFTISGSDIQMNVVGDAVDTIEWRVTGNITEHG